MNKLAIATDLQNAICGLELSPMEVKCLTVTWISHYPFLLEDFGWEIQAHTSLQNIVAEIEKLKTILENIQNNENPADLLKAVVAPTQDSDVVVTTENAEENKNDALFLPEKESDGDVIEENTPPSEVTGNVSEPPTEETSEVITEQLPRKGYSKYGRKLGRPAKPKNSDQNQNNTDQRVKGTRQKRSTHAPKTKSGSEKKSSKKATEPKETAEGTSPEVSPKADEITNLPTVTEATPPVTTSSLAAEDQSVLPSGGPQKETVDEIINRLKYRNGKEYEYELLYMVNNRYVRSLYKLREEAGVKPVGVIIPYTKQNNPYEIVVYYADDHALIPLSVAKRYAKNKLVAYKNTFWRVKNSTDDACIRPVLAKVNPIFKQMGGDELKGDYMDGRGQIYDASTKANLKIRYVCNIPLTDEPEE